MLKTKLRRAAALAAATVTLAAGVSLTTAGSASAATGCRAIYWANSSEGLQPCGDWTTPHTIVASGYLYGPIARADLYVNEFSGPGGTLLNSWKVGSYGCGGGTCRVSGGNVSVPNGHYYNVSFREYWDNSGYHWLDAQSPLFYLNDCTPRCS